MPRPRSPSEVVPPPPGGGIARELHDVRHLWLKGVLLLVWALVSFGAAYFARELEAVVVRGWPLSYWIAAQGALVAFIVIVAVYGWAMNRIERHEAQRRAAAASPIRQDGSP